MTLPWPSALPSAPSPHTQCRQQPSECPPRHYSGSTTFEDWITDAQATTLVIAPGVGAHEGMYASTTSMLTHAANTIVNALAANPSFSLEFLGHSLGGAVCALAAYTVTNSIGAAATQIKVAASGRNVTGSCFSTPPVLTMEAAVSTMPYVTSTIIQVGHAPPSSLRGGEKAAPEGIRAAIILPPCLLL